MAEVIAAFEQASQNLASTVEGMRDEQLFETVRFFTGPRTIGDMQRMAFLWMVLCDQIHHRGQFTIYLRMAGGQVPSIYGPTADEPWN
jgi:uncharacterized damage-inducible protein DinB